jgi:L-seryl-tRNA(Ser) seleniumtransferase
MDNGKLRALPQVGALLEREALAALAREVGPLIVRQAVREVIEEARGALARGGGASWSDEAIRRRALEIAGGTLAPVLNGTGVVVHTNLGRAPLAPAAIDALVRTAKGYSTLEYDLDEGERGDRGAHARRLITLLTGAEDALVVNNNAAAVLLALACLAPGREVVVSRGELVEIGGGFRVPDVLAQSGAVLVEVGTTNRTHPDDYARAIGDRTAALLKVHRSNFEMIGFTRDVALRELSAIAAPRQIPLVYDAGSGALGDVGIGEETVGAAIAAGADVVTFSGDKLLGGPQAGVIVGRAEIVARLRRHPLFRAVRPDKLCLAALHATLLAWTTDPGDVPVVRMIRASVDDLGARGARVAAGVGERASVVASTARVGGGAAPSAELPSRALRVEHGDPMALAAALRAGQPHVVARVEEDRVQIDLRTIDPADDVALAAAVRAALEAVP